MHLLLATFFVSTACFAQAPNWTQMTPARSPGVRNNHAMADDSSRQRTVLFGGNRSMLLADTRGDLWRRKVTWSFIA